MKRSKLLLILLIVTLNAAAQKLHIKDTDGNPVGYANVINHSGTVLGMSDLDGLVDITPMAPAVQDKPVTITHIAFKPVTLQLGNANSTQEVTLEETDFDMPEVTVTPKDFIYVQTYYRVLYMQDDTVVYYRAGLIDNAYDLKKKTLKTDSHHFSKAQYGILKFALNKLAGSTLESYADLPIKKNIASELTITKESPERERVSYKGQQIGNIINDLSSQQRRIAVDMQAFTRLVYQEQGKEKRLRRMDAKKNIKHNFYRVYQTDSEGNFGLEDFMMTQWLDDYDSYERLYKKDVHTRIWLESFSTDRAYVTKKELKERKKQNRREMNISSMRQFEQEHGVPAYAPQIQERLKVLFKKASD